VKRVSLFSLRLARTDRTIVAKNPLGRFSKPAILPVHSKWMSPERINPLNRHDKFRVHFDLETKGGMLLGVVRMSSTTDWYDITQGVMGGRIKGDTICFDTTERSLFGNETIPYKNRYLGSVARGEIRFVLQSDRPWGYPPQKFIAEPE
jgi:hypothetical protein